MRNPDRETIFRFKQFAVVNRRSAMKVGTDGVLLGAWAAGQTVSAEAMPRPQRILDVGCGTGVISLMMAQRFPQAEIYGIEIDPDSADEAQANFTSSPWADRLHLLRGDFLRFPFDGKFDLIVSNPPFFTNGLHAPDAARMQARHESSLTLAALLCRCTALLTPTGFIALVLPADRLAELLPSSRKGVGEPLSLRRLCRVSTVPRKEPRRILVEVKPQPSTETPTASVHPAETSTEHFSIHDSSGNFTPEYINLTKDFYLNF